MNIKGINYDVGTPTTHGTSSRETFDPDIVRRELEIIRSELHCNAIRIYGQDLERLALAGNFAIQQGLEVWFSPSLPDATPEAALQYFAECAQAAEGLRKQSSNTVFITGVELSAFMRGLLEGDTPMQRLGTLVNPLRLIRSTILKGSFHKKLNVFLAKAAALVREHFHGRITYASGSWENVDWSPFDFVGVDYYRDAMNKKIYEKNLREYFRHGRPVVITEFGCCTYQGAEEKGGYGWVVVDWNKKPPQLKRDLHRDETSQADYLIDLLQIFERENAEGAFAFTFVNPGYPHHANPLYDLDMASYSIVKSFVGQTGNTYHDMPWERKESFFKLADYFETH
jgi:hypothetical protein